MGCPKWGVQNKGPKLGSQTGVPNQGPKSGSQIGVPNRGPKSGSQIRVPNWGPKSELHFICSCYCSHSDCSALHILKRWQSHTDQSYYLHLAMQVIIMIRKTKIMNITITTPMTMWTRKTCNQSASKIENLPRPSYQSRSEVDKS
jgi:hypothetical protein